MLPKEKVYVIKISGTPEEQEKIFNEARTRLKDYDGKITYVILPDDVSPADFYLKEKLLDVVKEVSIETAKSGTSKLIEETFDRVFGPKKYSEK